MLHSKDVAAITTCDRLAESDAAVAARKIWERPQMQRLGAHEAEIGISGGNDADFLS